jgi:hypothetical protein
VTKRGTNQRSPRCSTRFPAGCWHGISGLYYAGRDDGLMEAAAEVTGEDPLDLRDQIRRVAALEEQ